MRVPAADIQRGHFQSHACFDEPGQLPHAGGEFVIAVVGAARGQVWRASHGINALERAEGVAGGGGKLAAFQGVEALQFRTQPGRFPAQRELVEGLHDGHGGRAGKRLGQHLANRDTGKRAVRSAGALGP